MKFIAVLLWVLPFFAAAQVLPPAPLASSTPAVAVPDSSAGWELRLGYEARKLTWAANTATTTTA